MHNVVKILTSDDGEVRSRPVWHLVMTETGAHSLCEGEYFGFGESGCEYEEKTVERGGITCGKCLEIIRKIKAVKL